MKRVTSLILVLIAIMNLNAFAMTPAELTALAVKQPPVVITGTGHRNLNTKETVLILFEFDTNPWKDIYSPTTGKAIGFTPPLSLKSHYWAWEQFELYDDGTHGDRIANDGVHSLLMQMPRDNKKWQLAIDDAGTARTAHESELAHLLKSAAAEAGIGFEGHFAILPDSSKVVGMTAKHFQDMIESGEIELASQKNKTAGSVTYSDEDKKYQTYYVHSTLGNDSNSGDSPDKPLKSFYKGVAKLKFNDTLIVGPGTYHIDLEAVRPFVENVENCWIVASPRGQAVITCAWKEALAGTLPWKQEKDGIYSTPDPGHLGPTGYFEHEGKITYMQKYLYDELISGKIIYKGFEDNPAKIPAHGFAVNYDDNRVYLRLPDNMNPNGRSMMIQAQHPSKGADSVIMKARNTRNLIIDGLVFEGADTAIKTYGPNNGLTIRNCLFGNCQAGADISASSDTMVEWCEYTFKGLEPYMKGLLKDNPKLTRLTYLFGKQHFNNEGGLETISGLTRHTSRFNYAHGSMDGTSWGGCIDSDFHHNVVYFMLDNCIEIDTVMVNYGKDMRVHHNLFLNAFFGPISQQYGGKENVGANRPGPLYFYRNVVMGYDGIAWNSWTVIKGVAQLWEKGYIHYNNTYYMKEGTLYALAKEQTSPQAQKSLWFMNNILLFENGYTPWYSADQPQAQTANNIFVSPKQADSLLVNQGLHLKSVQEVGFTKPDMGILVDDIIENDPFDFSLSQSSPAVDAGRKLPAHWPESDRYIGKAPDIGAHEHGEKTDSHGIEYNHEWPRPRQTRYIDTVPDGFTKIKGWD